MSGATAPSDTRCPICYGLWSPFPCPYDPYPYNRAQEREEDE